MPPTPKGSRGVRPITRSDGSVGWRAEAYDKVMQRRQHKTFDSKRAAEAWREDMRTKFRSGQARASGTKKLADVWSSWHLGVLDGVIRNRSGAAYKASVRRGYLASFEHVWLPKLGHVPTAELRTVYIQRVVDELVADGAAAQTVRNHVTALRAVLKWAVRQEFAHVNACDNLALPSGGSKRDRVASPSEALDLCQALPDKLDRALWACAFFTGLRRGELLGLRWEDVDLAERTITVRRSWDDGGRTFTTPKTKAGARTLRFPEVLAGFLAALDGTEGLVFANPKGNPLKPTEIAQRARKAWQAADLEPITLHECRHTYASLMIAAGVNIKTIQEWMGHSSITTTMDRYGHLLPNGADVAKQLLDSYIKENA